VLADGLCDQHKRYNVPAVPPVISLVAMAYSWYGGAVTDVVEDNPANVLTPLTSAPQAFADSKIRATFDDAKLTPESCNEHATVKVHPVAFTCGPETWKMPTWKL
jgi:hypothetical protein